MFHVHPRQIILKVVLYGIYLKMSLVLLCYVCKQTNRKISYRDMRETKDKTWTKMMNQHKDLQVPIVSTTTMSDHI